MTPAPHRVRVVRAWRSRVAEARRNDGLLANVSWLVGSQVVSAGVGLVYWAVAAHLMPSGDVGLGAAAITAMTAISFFCVLGAETFLIGALRAAAADRRRVVLTTGLLVPGLLGGVVGVFFGLVAPHLSSSLRATGGNPLNVALFAVGAAVGTSCLVFDFAVLGVDRASVQFHRNVIAAALKLLLIPAALAVGVVGSAGLTQSWVLSLAVSLAAGMAMLGLPRPGVRHRWTDRAALVRAHAGGSLGHYALNMALASGPIVVPVIVAFTSTPSDVAYFSAARLVAVGLLAVPYLLTVGLFAGAMADPSTLRRRVRQTLPLSLGFYLVVLAGLLFAGRPLLQLFGSSYASQSWEPLLLLTAVGIPLVIRDHYVVIRRSEGATTSAAKVIGRFTAVELTVTFLAGQRLGLNGLCLSWLATMIGEAAVLTPVVLRFAWGSRAERGRSAVWKGSNP